MTRTQVFNIFTYLGVCDDNHSLSIPRRLHTITTPAHKKKPTKNCNTKTEVSWCQNIAACFPPNANALLYKLERFAQCAVTGFGPADTVGRVRELLCHWRQLAIATDISPILKNWAASGFVSKLAARPALRVVKMADKGSWVNLKGFAFLTSNTNHSAVYQIGSCFGSTYQDDNIFVSTCHKSVDFFPPRLKLWY